MDEFLKRWYRVFFSSALKDHLETGSSDLPGSQEDPPALVSLGLCGEDLLDFEGVCVFFSV